MFAQQPDIKIIVGQRGSGKTSLAKHLVEKDTRLIVLDSAGFGEFGGYQAASFADLKDYIAWSSPDGHGVFRVSYQPEEDEYGAMFDLAAAVNFSKAKDDYVNQTRLVLEEADLIPPPNRLIEYRNAIVRGRHWGVNILAMAVDPTLLPKTLRRQADDIYMFRSIDRDDIDWARETFVERADELSTLEDHYYLHWSVGQIDKNKLDM